MMVFFLNRIALYKYVMCNILTYISSINTWASRDSPLAQLVKELDLCLFLCVIRRLRVRDTAERINNLPSHYTCYVMDYRLNIFIIMFLHMMELTLHYFLIGTLRILV